MAQAENLTGCRFGRLTVLQRAENRHGRTCWLCRCDCGNTHVAAARDLVQDILLEVNIGREAAKSGFAPEEVLPGAEAALERTHVRVRGLMTIPPADADRDANFRYFQEVQALYVDMNKKLFHNELEYLSMGMSGDYEDAIRAGATMVRVGSAIFGARHYN